MDRLRKELIQVSTYKDGYKGSVSSGYNNAPVLYILTSMWVRLNAGILKYNQNHSSSQPDQLVKICLNQSCMISGWLEYP